MVRAYVPRAGSSLIALVTLFKFGTSHRNQNSCTFCRILFCSSSHIFSVALNWLRFIGGETTLPVFLYSAMVFLIVSSPIPVSLDNLDIASRDFVDGFSVSIRLYKLTMIVFCPDRTYCKTKFTTLRNYDRFKSRYYDVTKAC